MPSALPKAVIRASEERTEAWKAYAVSQGESFSRWAGRILDQAIGVAADEPEPITPVRSECPRAMWHRPGVHCKACGVTP